MLTEWEGVRQRPEEGLRRWFTDDRFDLIVWYESDEVVGFQLCYAKETAEKAVTWYRTGSYTHAKVDDGEGPFSSKKTPVLVSDGVFEVDRVMSDFREAATAIDPQIADLVYQKLRDYTG
jgi:hypothetical protein